MRPGDPSRVRRALLGVIAGPDRAEAARSFERVMLRLEDFEARRRADDDTREIEIPITTRDA